MTISPNHLTYQNYLHVCAPCSAALLHAPRHYLVHNDISLDPASHTVSFKEEPINLSRREFALLHVLLENAGRVLSREHLTQSLYGWGEEVDSNALEVHVHNLRKRFGQEFIRTVRGIGYTIEKSKDEK